MGIYPNLSLSFSFSRSFVLVRVSFASCSAGYDYPVWSYASMYLQVRPNLNDSMQQSDGFRDRASLPETACRTVSLNAQCLD